MLTENQINANLGILESEDYYKVEKDAEDATKEAEKSGTRCDHEKALLAHFKAQGVLIGMLAKKYGSGITNYVTKYAYHREQMSKHHSKAINE